MTNDPSSGLRSFEWLTITAPPSISISRHAAAKCPADVSGGRSHKSDCFRDVLRIKQPVSIKHIAHVRACSKHNALDSRARSARKIVMKSRLNRAPIVVFGEECLTSGALPDFMTAGALEASLQELPSGGRMATTKCISAWRDGQLESVDLFHFLKSISWQSPTLAMTMHSAPLSRSSSASTSAEEADEVLSEQDMAALMAAADVMG
jgi:hypothetical protein